MSEIQLVRAGLIAITSLKDHATGRFAIVPVRRHLNDSTEPFQFVQGQLNPVIINAVADDIKAVFKRHNRKNADKNQPSKEDNQVKTNDILPSGTVCSAEIVNSTPTVLNLKLEGGKFRGRCHISEAILDEQIKLGVKPFESFLKGQSIKVRILGVHHKAHHQKQLKAKMFECSLLVEKPPHRKHQLFGEADIHEGVKIPIFVRDYRQQYANVEFSRLVSRPARINRLNILLNNTDTDCLASIYPPGTCLGEATVIKTSPHIEFSLVGVPAPVVPGTVQQGLVYSKSSSTGLQISFADGSLGLVALTDISDSFQSYPTKNIKMNSSLQVFVMKRLEDGNWQLSARSSKIVKPEHDTKIQDREVDTAADIVIGELLRGFVVVCNESKGVFVRLGRNLVGRASFNNACDYFLTDPKKYFQPGLMVTAKVLAIEFKDTSRHVDISLLEKDTGVALDVPKKLIRGKRSSCKSETEHSQHKRQRVNSVNSTASVVEHQDTLVSNTPVVQATLPSFDFSATDVVQPPLISTGAKEIPSDNDDNEEDERGGKKQRKETAKEKEQRTFALEMARLKAVDDPEHAEPATVDDFDRLVIEKPNSSLVWSKYIAYHLANMEDGKAREVAERALKSISFREETERLNIWVTYFNLENIFGTDENLREIVRRASQEADAFTVYERLIDVFVNSGKIENAEHQLNVMTKKFRENPAVWIKQGEFFFNQGKPESARKALNKALDALEERHHIDLIIKFALMEMSGKGDFERGRSLFEKIISNYPKRLDVWNIYSDALMKWGQQDVAGVRKLFERQIQLQLPYNKAKFIFRRFAAFENAHGDEESMKKVEEMAKEYLEKSQEKMSEQRAGQKRKFEEKNSI